MENEQWKVSVISEHYEVSNLGRVRSLGFDYIDISGRRCVAYPRIIKTCFNKRIGYIGAVLRVNKKPKTISLHRLVARTWIPNPYNKAQVNHKDGNKLNNAVDNLEWMTKSENHKHRFEVLKQIPNCKGLFNRHGSKPVNQLDLNGKIINSFPSLNQASRETNTNRTAISSFLTGRFKTAGGCKWEYKKD